MEVVSEGSLESISRPPSSSKRSSSRSSVLSSSQCHGSLDILPPEDPSSWAKPEIEEDVVVTDITGDLNTDEDQSLALRDYPSAQLKTCQPDEKTIDNKADEDENNVITCEVVGTRSGFESTMPNLEQDSETSSVTGTEDLNDIDPKIRKGLEKIKKLDKILSEKLKKEKEVKKQRLEQERMWREHIESLEQTRDAQLGKQVDLGPAHLLALGAPEDTAEESQCEESPPVTPVFATQPIVDEAVLEGHELEGKYVSRSENKDVLSNNKENVQAKSSEIPNKSSQAGEKNAECKDDSKRNRKVKKTKKKDFIKRNILLAADANNIIAMTEEEKKRLDELLSDVNSLVDESSDKDIGSLTLYGDGFQPSQDEVKQLADIDFRLQALLPSEEYDAFCNQTTNEQDKLSQVGSPRSNTTSGMLEEESQTFGELVLQEKKDMREMKQRLQAIEEQLDRFQTLDVNEGVLSESLLRQLLDGSSRTTSQATTIFDRISSLSTSMSYDTNSSFDCNSIATESPSPLEQALEQ